MPIFNEYTSSAMNIKYTHTLQYVLPFVAGFI